MRSQQALATLVAITLPLAVWAQQQPAAPAPPPATQTAAAAPAAKVFSQQDLDTILAPIALYQDALLAQIFMASTYPLEVVEAARWSAANPGVKDKALQDAMEKQKWDPSVKSLTSVPTVLKHMNDKLDWTQKLGDAFLAQQADVMTTVQSLRAKAAANGNLKTTPEQTVKTTQEGTKTVYVVESAKPEVVYVPTYNPSVVYGTWWYPSYPPYYMYPPAYVYPPGLAFATGVVVGAAIWGNVNWGNNNVNINVNQYNNFNKTNISNNNNNWNHNAEHRKGVAYKDQGTAQKYNRGGNTAATQSRESFRGHADSARGSGDFGGGNAARQQGAGAGAGSRDSAANRQAASNMNRPSPSASSQSRGGGSGFSGAGSGAQTRAASSRGSASRGSGGGGGRRR